MALDLKILQNCMIITFYALFEPDYKNKKQMTKALKRIIVLTFISLKFNMYAHAHIVCIQIFLNKTCVCVWKNIKFYINIS